MASLTPKQQRFVQEYLVDLNAAAAARRTGYSVRTPAEASKAGWRLLQRREVREAIREAMLERQKRTEITADYVLSNLMEIVERSMQRAPVLSRRGEQLVDGEDRHVWRFDGRTASRALELMGRHLGMFAEHARTPVSGDLSISWEGGQAQSSAPKPSPSDGEEAAAGEIADRMSCGPGSPPSAPSDPSGVPASPVSPASPVFPAASAAFTPLAPSAASSCSAPPASSETDNDTLRFAFDAGRGGETA